MTERYFYKKFYFLSYISNSAHDLKTEKYRVQKYSKPFVLFIVILKKKLY